MNPLFTVSKKVPPGGYAVAAAIVMVLCGDCKGGVATYLERECQASGTDGVVQAVWFNTRRS